MQSYRSSRIIGESELLNHPLVRFALASRLEQAHGVQAIELWERLVTGVIWGVELRFGPQLPRPRSS